MTICASEDQYAVPSYTRLPVAFVRGEGCPECYDTGHRGRRGIYEVLVATRELRADPGTGATTWLMRIEAGATVPWQSSSVVREGYLVSGTYRHSECVAGEVVTEVYNPGGYFYRPANAVNGGPASQAVTDSVWLLREAGEAVHAPADGCVPPE